MNHTRFQNPKRRLLGIKRQTCDRLSGFFFKNVTRRGRVRSLRVLVALLIAFCICLYFFIGPSMNILGVALQGARRLCGSGSVVRTIEHQPEEPWRLAGLQLRKRTYTRQDLLDLYGNLSFIYSFVNGSEMNQFYRKRMARTCGPVRGQPVAGGEPGGRSPGPVPQRCHPKFLNIEPGATLGDIHSWALHGASKEVNFYDRETDELRHSLRSVEQHMRWHRGRVVIVSPGHRPHWIDAARNFLAGSCGGADVEALRKRGKHLRLMTVHQDAVLPHGLRLSVNSHIIEQHLWRVRNITSMHVYFNDDYFVNRDVDISDLLNEYGGSIVRVEDGDLKIGEACPEDKGWEEGVRHTELFNIIELDQNPEDFLPSELMSQWRKAGRLRDKQATMDSPPQTEVVNTAYSYEWPLLSFNGTLEARRTRYYSTHAPFVYCTNMFRFFSTRYEREFAFNALHNRVRMCSDIYIPFLYNAFILTRPWQASSKFLPYLWRLNEYRELVANCSSLAEEPARGQAVPPPPLCNGSVPAREPPVASIMLDNTDGCAPATLLIGPESGAHYSEFSDEISSNEEVLRGIDDANPLFFNINSGFTSPDAIRQLTEFMHRKFPDPMYLEAGVPPVSSADAALGSVYGALMELPVIGVVSYREGVCPLVRSLQLSLPDHRGELTVVVRPLSVCGGVEPTLEELRAELRDGVWGVMAVVGCAYNERVRERVLQRGRSVMDLVRDVLGDAGGVGVELPASCGGSGGVRVRGFVVDAQTSEAPVVDASALRSVLAMPGQTLALEDFDVVRLDEEGAGVVLVLSRGAADVKGVHWITGASEVDLLQSYPLPHDVYENMSAGVSMYLVNLYSFVFELR